MEGFRSRRECALLSPQYPYTAYTGSNYFVLLSQIINDVPPQLPAESELLICSSVAMLWVDCPFCLQISLSSSAISFLNAFAKSPSNVLRLKSCFPIHLFACMTIR